MAKDWTCASQTRVIFLLEPFLLDLISFSTLSYSYVNTDFVIAIDYE